MYRLMKKRCILGHPNVHICIQHGTVTALFKLFDFKNNRMEFKGLGTLPIPSHPSKGHTVRFSGGGRGSKFSPHPPKLILCEIYHIFFSFGLQKSYHSTAKTKNIKSKEGSAGGGAPVPPQPIQPTGALIDSSFPKLDDIKE